MEIAVFSVFVGMEKAFFIIVMMKRFLCKETDFDSDHVIIILYTNREGIINGSF